MFEDSDIENNADDTIIYILIKTSQIFFLLEAPIQMFKWVLNLPLLDKAAPFHCKALCIAADTKLAFYC